MAPARTQGRPSDLAEGEMRERLLHEAARLFAESGYAGTSIQAIVNAAGATKPMVYYYFEGKEGLYRELVAEAYGRVRRELEQIDIETGDIEDRLVALVEANFKLYREEPDLAMFVLLPVLTPARDAPQVDIEGLAMVNYRLLRCIVADGIEQGELVGDTDEITLSLMGQIVFYKMAHSVVGEHHLVGTAAARQMVRLLLEGARPRR